MKWKSYANESRDFANKSRVLKEFVINHMYWTNCANKSCGMTEQNYANELLKNMSDFAMFMGI